MKEIWKAIPGFEGLYKVSSFGRVKRLDKTIKSKNKWGKQTRFLKEKFLKQFHCGNHYPAVTLTRDRKMYPMKYVHSLVLLAFVGPRPKGMQCCHYDGSRTNNKIENLRYGTQRENAVDDERRLKGKTPAQKLFKHEIKEIKTLLSMGVKQKKIAKKYKVCAMTICRINTNKDYNDK